VGHLAIDALEVLLSLGLILLAAELFTNAIEWLGYKLKLAEGAVGSVLAAVGTALPETIIPIVAIVKDAQAHRLFTPASEAQAVGLRAIIGAPFMLGTLALAIVGGTYLTTRHGPQRPDEFTADPRGLRSDAEFFMLAFTFAAGMGVLRHYFPIPRPVDWVLAAGFVGVYFLYLRRVMASGGSGDEIEKHGLHPLYIVRSFIGPHKEPKFHWVIAQLVLALLVMFGGAHLFVEHLGPLALALHVPPLILALLIVPVATELPEKFNSVIWVRRGKDTLALGNISGALVFQSTFPVTLGLVFLDWRFSPLDPALIGAVFGLLGVLIVYIGMRVTGKVQPRLLLTAGGLYLVYLVLIVLHQNSILRLDVPATAVAAAGAG
jgi:cation:H+ antiporter